VRDFEVLKSQGGFELVLVGSPAAFIGLRLLKKNTMQGIQKAVGITWFLLSMSLGDGLV